MTVHRRHLVIAGSALVHAALLGLLFAAPTPDAFVADVGGLSVSLVDGKALAAAQTPKAAAAPHPPPPQTAELKPVVSTDVTPQWIDTRLRPSSLDQTRPAEDPVAISVAAAGAAGQACQLTQWLQTALQADPQVQTALPLIPRRARSVANAIMLWNGAWVESPSGAEGLSAIRRALVSGIAAAPAACRDQLVRGPELLILADASGSTVVAVGSGEWRWADLLAGEAPRLAYDIAARL